MRISKLWILLIIGNVSCLQDEPLKINKNSIPENTGDHWTIRTPTQEGVNNDVLNEAIDYFFSSQELNNSKALLIARNGHLIVEAYCKDLADRDRKHNVKSVTKSITSVLTGMAIKQGVLNEDLSRAVHSYIPEYFDTDTAKHTITMLHCLTMTTGLEDPFYTVAPVLPGNSVSTCLNVTLLNQPGTAHAYNNGSANIVAGVIESLLPNSFESFAKKQLFDVLDIQDYHWVKHNDDRVNAAFDLYLYPRDLLKWGQLCLQNGEWNGELTLPNQWMEESTRYYEDGFDGKFGYHWWLLEEYDGYYANGYGGQRVWVIPSENLVVVHLAEPSTDQTDLTEIPLLLEKIMKAI